MKVGELKAALACQSDDDSVGIGVCRKPGDWQVTAISHVMNGTGIVVIATVDLDGERFDWPSRRTDQQIRAPGSAHYAEGKDH